MGKLFNVRLSAEEAAIVDELRRRGVVASEVVRHALREELSRQHGEGKGLAAVDLLLRLREKHAAPARWKGRRVNASDRREVSAFLRERLMARGKRRNVDGSKRK